MPSPLELWQLGFGRDSTPQQTLDRLRVALGNLVASPRDSVVGAASLLPAIPYMGGRPGMQVDPQGQKEAMLTALGGLPGLRQLGELGDRISAGARTSQGGSVDPGVEMLLGMALPGGFFKGPQGKMGKGALERLRTAPPLLRRLRTIEKASPDEKVLYHGTKSDFDRFDPARIGSGQGASSYGPGFYMAENPDVAKSYMQELSNPRVVLGRNEINRKDLTVDEERVYRLVFGNYEPGSTGSHLKDVELAIRDAEDGIRQYDDFADLRLVPDEKQAKRQKMLAILNDWKDKGLTIKTSGFVHRVAVPREVESNLLDWDLPISEQPKQIREAANRFAASNGLSTNGTGGDLYHAFMQDQADGMIPLYESQEALEEAMEAAGFAGIKYLDAGSRAAGGTRNFVLLPRVAEGKARILKVKEHRIYPASRRKGME